jgi:hypothetical protein
VFTTRYGLIPYIKQNTFSLSKVKLDPFLLTIVIKAKLKCSSTWESIQGFNSHVWRVLFVFNAYLVAIDLIQL